MSDRTRRPASRALLFAAGRDWRDDDGGPTAGIARRPGGPSRADCDPRRRLRRPGHGDPPQAGGRRRLHRLRARPRTSAAPGGPTPIPGCQCDIPSHLYSFSFAPNPDWTPHLPASSPSCATTCARLPTQLRRAATASASARGAAARRWDEAADLWRIETGDGEFTADVLIAAPGPLSEPSMPDLPGLDDFAGTIFHTARWNHDHDLRRRARRGRRHRRVGDPGRAPDPARSRAPRTSSSARRRGSSRTATGRSRDLERRVYRRFPPLQRAVRAGVYWSAASCSCRGSSQPQILKALERIARTPHGATRSPTRSCARRSRRATRSAASGSCRPTTGTRRLRRRNVELVTDGIARDRARTDRDGRRQRCTRSTRSSSPPAST